MKIKSLTVVGPYLVDELFAELGIDKNQGRNGYVLEQFRKREEEMAKAFYLKGFNTGAQQQRLHDEPQTLDKIEYHSFLNYYD
jgi:hypothetical protein